MRGHVRTHHDEECVHWQVVHGAEFHGMRQQAERNEGPPNVQKNRVTHVRDGDAAPDPRGSHGLARLEHGDEKVAVHTLRERQQSHDLPEHFGR